MAVNLRQLFLSLQSQLDAKLQTNRGIIPHPGAKGGAAELDWRGMLADYLPWRYHVSKAFVLDCDGSMSDEIDVVIYDRQYSPLLFNQGGALYVPAESVYAVFEVKQELTRDTVQYAASKAASVRRLRRTSAAIRHAGGRFEPRSAFRILAGVLCLVSSWRPPLGEPFVAALRGLAENERLDLGCCLRHGAFEVSYPRRAPPALECSPQDGTLIFFFLRLLGRLQEMGTVPAIDLSEYAKAVLRSS